MVAALLESCRRAGVSVRFGARVVGIEEVTWEERDSDGATNGAVMVVARLEDGETVDGDVLVGCDGIHSAARRMVVEPDREPVYSGKAVAYGTVALAEPGALDVVRPDGRPAVEDTTLFTGPVRIADGVVCGPRPAGHPRRGRAEHARGVAGGGGGRWARTRLACGEDILERSTRPRLTGCWTWWRRWMSGICSRSTGSLRAVAGAKAECSSSAMLPMR